MPVELLSEDREPQTSLDYVEGDLLELSLTAASGRDESANRGQRWTRDRTD